MLTGGILVVRLERFDGGDVQRHEPFTAVMLRGIQYGRCSHCCWRWHSEIVQTNEPKRCGRIAQLLFKVIIMLKVTVWRWPRAQHVVNEMETILTQPWCGSEIRHSPCGGAYARTHECAAGEATWTTTNWWKWKTLTEFSTAMWCWCWVPTM